MKMEEGTDEEDCSEKTSRSRPRLPKAPHKQGPTAASPWLGLLIEQPTGGTACLHSKAMMPPATQGAYQQQGAEGLRNGQRLSFRGRSSQSPVSRKTSKSGSAYFQNKEEGHPTMETTLSERAFQQMKEIRHLSTKRRNYSLWNIALCHTEVSGQVAVTQAITKMHGRPLRAAKRTKNEFTKRSQFMFAL